jgi:hypothetical protein
MEQHQAIADAHNNLASECDAEGFSKWLKPVVLARRYTTREANITGRCTTMRRTRPPSMNSPKTAPRLSHRECLASFATIHTCARFPRFGGKPIAKTDIDEEFRDLVKAAADREGE